ncbi:hypothetical protein R5W23_004452 [Gemmata sp. JC673]|uniref:Uncharacterized protein n=1 Tax=Gemmata algarum TaxID=2975278 RepID=A0ABU5F700_9BACT|nr:hypothetical protein [Gemmata algarum]MDY3562969.1 hypothetical protein [Gemmata algarum]
MTVFEAMPLFLVALLGSALGAVFGYFTGYNIYLLTLAGGYGTMLPLIVATIRVRPKEPEQPRRSENVHALIVFVFLSLASCAVLPVLILLASLKIQKYLKIIITD